VSDDQPVVDVLAVIMDIGLMLENSAVFQSQVGEQLIAMQSMGLKTGVVAVSEDRKRFEAVIGQRLRAAGVYIALIDAGRTVGTLWRLGRELRRVRKAVNVRSAYVRGLWGPLVIALANPLNRVRFVYDARGATGDETAVSGTHRLKRTVYLRLEAWGIRSAAHVTAVSRYLADAVSAEHGRSPVRVIPSCVNVSALTVAPATVASVRQKLGYSPNERVFVYSGGLSHYQQVPAMLALWRRFLLEPDVRFLLLTNDDPHARVTVGDLSDFGNKLTRLSVPRGEIPAILAAGNLGFVMRDARVLNRAASPVKFAEYLAAGLAVVASPGTGDSSDLVARLGIGVLVDPQQLDEGEVHVRNLLLRARKDPAGLAAHCREAAALHYDWKAYESVYRTIYDVPRDAAVGSREQRVAPCAAS
jgi:glycosyltransferase involved in cell wall biosynthesis